MQAPTSEPEYMWVFKSKNGKQLTTTNEVQAAAMKNGGLELVDQLPL